MRSRSKRLPGEKWKSLILFGMRSIRAVYPMMVQANTSDMCLGSVQCRKKCDSERVGYDRESGRYGKVLNAGRLCRMKKFSL